MNTEIMVYIHIHGFPDSSVGKESTCNVGNPGLTPGLGRSPGEGIGYPLHCSGLENPMDYIVYGVTKSQTRLSNFHFHFSVSYISTYMYICVCVYIYIMKYRDFPGSIAGKESTCKEGDPSSIPRSGQSPGEGIGYPLQYSWASLVA